MRRRPSGRSLEKARAARQGLDEERTRGPGPGPRHHVAWTTSPTSTSWSRPSSRSSAVKQALFENLDEICKPGAILATTTSSLPVIECAAATRRPEDVVGLHFFNPAPVMKLVEVVHTVSTGARRRRHRPGRLRAGSASTR